jgi:hypothetical protein
MPSITIFEAKENPIKSIVAPQHGHVGLIPLLLLLLLTEGMEADKPAITFAYV